MGAGVAGCAGEAITLKAIETKTPGDAPLGNTAGVQVAALGLLHGPTVPCGLIAEAATETWGTCATLAHTPTAWTIVT